MRPQLGYLRLSAPGILPFCNEPGAAVSVWSLTYVRER